MSPIVVAAFPDRASARAAADSLSQSGIAGIEVRLHPRAVPVTNALEVEVDELATGGFFGNFVELLDELLDVHPPETKAVTYDEKVRKEGTLVAVRVPSAQDAERVSAALQERGATRISRLPQPGLED
jgi:hypothetical protein